MVAKNNELAAMQDKLLVQERQLITNQLIGATAHNLGQPVSAILLNCHLLENLPANDEKFKVAVESILKDFAG
ncbi:MAG: hypothetical protein R3A13_04745 [Bdellovibrionota bacterium]